MPEIPLKWGFCLGPEERTAFCQMLDKVSDNLPEGQPLIYYEIGIGNADTMLAVHSWLTQRQTPHTIIGADLPGYHGGALNYNFNDQPSATFGNICLALIGSEAFLSNVTQKADFIFIDACHGAPCVTRDFLLAEKKINRGGIIAFHDTDPNCQGHHFQEHCGTGIDVRCAVQELGLLDDTRPGWKKVGETAGKFPEYHGCLFVQYKPIIQRPLTPIEQIFVDWIYKEAMKVPRIQRPWVKQHKASHASRSHDPFYQTKEWKAIRLQQLEREPLCSGPDSYCTGMGRVTPATVADHIIPRNQGGADSLSNLQSLCTSCHNKKSAKE